MGSKLSAQDIWPLRRAKKNVIDRVSKGLLPTTWHKGDDGIEARAAADRQQRLSYAGDCDATSEESSEEELQPPDVAEPREATADIGWRVHTKCSPHVHQQHRQRLDDAKAKCEEEYAKAKHIDATKEADGHSDWGLTVEQGRRIPASQTLAVDNSNHKDPVAVVRPEGPRQQLDHQHRIQAHGTFDCADLLRMCPEAASHIHHPRDWEQMDEEMAFMEDPFGHGADLA